MCLTQGIINCATSFTSAAEGGFLEYWDTVLGCACFWRKVFLVREAFRGCNMLCYFLYLLPGRQLLVFLEVLHSKMQLFLP